MLNGEITVRSFKSRKQIVDGFCCQQFTPILNLTFCVSGWYNVFSHPSSPGFDPWFLLYFRFSCDLFQVFPVWFSCFVSSPSPSPSLSSSSSSYSSYSSCSSYSSAWFFLLFFLLHLRFLLLLLLFLLLILLLLLLLLLFAGDSAVDATTWSLFPQGVRPGQPTTSRKDLPVSPPFSSTHVPPPVATTPETRLAHTHTTGRKSKKGPGCQNPKQTNKMSILPTESQGRTERNPAKVGICIE